MNSVKALRFLKYFILTAGYFLMFFELYTLDKAIDIGATAKGLQKLFICLKSKKTL